MQWARLSELAKNPKFWVLLAAVSVFGFMVILFTMIAVGSTHTSVSVAVDVINGSVDNLSISYSDPDTITTRMSDLIN